MLRGFAPAPQEHFGSPGGGQVDSHRASPRYDPLAGRPIPGQLLSTNSDLVAGLLSSGIMQTLVPKSGDRSLKTVVRPSV